MTMNEFFTTAGMRRITNGQDTPRSLYQAMHRYHRIANKFRVSSQFDLANKRINMMRIFVSWQGEKHFRDASKASRIFTPVTNRSFWKENGSCKTADYRNPPHLSYGNIRRGLAVMQSKAVS